MATRDGGSDGDLCGCCGGAALQASVVCDGDRSQGQTP